jgi:outer membrane protein assembly factor BamD (BamD/ComL family)
MSQTHQALGPIALLLALLPSCGATRLAQQAEARYTPEQVPAVLELARAAVETQTDLERTLTNVRSARSTGGLTPELRLEVQNVLEATTRAVIAHSQDADLLEAIMGVDVPRQLAVEAGLRSAELLFHEGERMGAFRLIKRMDSKFPQHHERSAAGGLLGEIGFNLAEDDGSYGLIFKYRSLAGEVLEYLVMNYPSHPGGDQTLWTLGSLYQEQRELDLAIEKNQDLLLWFPTSSLAPLAQARIPHLRLMIHGDPKYDRATLVQAHGELQDWLNEYRAHESESAVRSDMVDATRRLADSDLILAQFYATLGSAEGVQLHARRALAEAREGGDPSQVQKADELLREWAERSKNAGGTDS